MKNSIKRNDYGCLTILSSYSRDKIIGKDGGVTIKKGGPLFFIENALKEIHVAFKSFYGPTINVEITVGKDGETGKVLSLPSINSLPKLNTSNEILISTICNEWNLEDISKINTKIYLDIQGYIRQTDNLGKKKRFKEIKRFFNRIYCLKGTKEEMSYLPRAVIEEQKKRLLVITNGEKGVKYYFKGKEYLKPIKRKTKPGDTIGAGDSFFGYLVGFLLQKKSVHRSISKAVTQTFYFLSDK